MPLIVISESVFERIPQDELPRLLLILNAHALAAARRLFILTRPMIFTGICVSHLTEWYYNNVYSQKLKRPEPREHLRKNRFVADTCLNRLSRDGFRALFKNCGFKVLAETLKYPEPCREFLTDPSLENELAEWSDDEHLSNEVMFELVPAADTAG